MKSLVEPIDLPIQSDVALPGLAQIAGSVGDDLEAFGCNLIEAGLQASSARSFRIGLKELFDRLRGRQLIEDRGPFPVMIDWLGFHIPPGGKGKLTLADEVGSNSSVELKIMGMGGGTRRAVTLGAERDFGERTACFRIGLSLDVHILTWATNGTNTLEVNVGQITGSYVRQDDVCPLCGYADGPPRRRARPFGEPWDLSADKKGITETISYSLQEELGAQIGLDIPLLGSALKPAVELNRSVKSSCKAAYTLPGGARFQAYQLLDRSMDLPFWLRH